MEQTIAHVRLLIKKELHFSLKTEFSKMKGNSFIPYHPCKSPGSAPTHTPIARLFILNDPFNERCSYFTLENHTVTLAG